MTFKAANIQIGNVRHVNVEQCFNFLTWQLYGAVNAQFTQIFRCLKINEIIHRDKSKD